jgi:hypothetical protein
MSLKPRSTMFFFCSILYVCTTSVKRKKRILDLSKPIISNSHTLIALLRWKALGLGSHILKLNLLLSQKKHLVLPCSSSTTTSSNRLKTQDSHTHFNVSSNFNWASLLIEININNPLSLSVSLAKPSYQSFFESFCLHLPYFFL